MKKTRPSGTPTLLIGTAKGGFLFKGDASRRRWKLQGPFFLGQRAHDFRADPRDGRTLLLAASGGATGSTIYRSVNQGKTWRGATRAPRFGRLPKGKEPLPATGSRGFDVQAPFFLAPGHVWQKGVWYCGTRPSGLFRSEDGGRTWDGVPGFNDRPSWWDWTGGGQHGSAGGALLHSIQIDPRDPDHLYVSLSRGGTFESFDGGRHWKPLNRGVAADLLPEKHPEYGQDPHCMVQHPGDPDRLYQQNRTGLYRLDRARTNVWERIGKRMPKAIGDVGFPLAVHPKDPDTLWVFPMDRSRAWPRTSPGARPAVYRTCDAGKSWQRLDAGLPRANAWFTVLRQALDADSNARRTGVTFGTTSGSLWTSRDRGESWSSIAEHLPRILSVRATRL